MKILTLAVLALLIPVAQDDNDVRRQLEVVRAEMTELREVKRENSKEYKRLEQKEKELVAKLSKGQERELKKQISDLKRKLTSTKDEKKKKRIQASIENLKMKLKHLKEGKLEHGDEENPEARMAAMTPGLSRWPTRPR